MTCILRPPEYSDYDWMREAYKSWPKGIVTEHEVGLFLRRWIERGNPICRVLVDDDVPVGLITYELKWFEQWVHNVLVLPEHREKGYFKQMVQLVREEVEPQGIVVAQFKTIPGSPIEGRYPDNTVAMGDPL